MEAVLTGIPQFILTSVNFLITSAQAGYISNLDKTIAKRIEHRNVRHFKKFEKSWHLIFLGELLLASSAILLIAARIIPSLFFCDTQERVNPYFITMDIILIAATLAGYSFITAHAFYAWRWRSWGGRTKAELGL